MTETESFTTVFYVCACVCDYVCVGMCVCVCTHANTHTQSHTHALTHIHTDKPKQTHTTVHSLGLEYVRLCMGVCVSVRG